MRTRVLLAVLLVAAVAVPAQAATTEVTVDSSDLAFRPAKVRPAVGDTVVWHKTDGVHNVSSTTGMFRSGAPSGAAFDFSVTFSAGSYPYVCEVHSASMRGTVRVPPRVTDGPAGPAFKVRWATAGTQTGSRFTVQYRVADGDWTTWKPRTGRNAGAFGADGSPVTVRAGTTYRFRVKSRSGDDASRYSPKAAFTP